MRAQWPTEEAPQESGGGPHVFSTLVAANWHRRPHRLLRLTLSLAFFTLSSSLRSIFNPLLSFPFVALEIVVFFT